MFVELLTLRQQFVVIDSPVDFQLVANPVLVQDEQGFFHFPENRVKGTDICSRRAGAWQINAWKLLNKEEFPLRPVFTMALVYDETLLEEGQEVSVSYSDINVGEGIAGVNGQLVTISPSDFKPILSAIDDVNTELQVHRGLLDSSNTSLTESLSVQKSIDSKIGADSVTGTILNKLEQMRTRLQQVFDILDSNFMQVSSNFMQGSSNFEFSDSRFFPLYSFGSGAKSGFFQYNVLSEGASWLDYISFVVSGDNLVFGIYCVDDDPAYFVFQIRSGNLVLFSSSHETVKYSFEVGWKLWLY